MTSKVNVCNMAISFLGESKFITSLTEKSKSAEVCSLFVDIARQAVLTEAPWPFATAFFDLGLLTENPTDEWAYSYSYPSGCLHVRRILSGNRQDTTDTKVPYKIIEGTAGTEIYTDMQDATCEYTADIEATSRMPNDFIMAWAHTLASMVATSLTSGDPYKLSDKNQKMAEAWISKAFARQINEEEQDTPLQSEFIRGR